MSVSRVSNLLSRLGPPLPLRANDGGRFLSSIVGIMTLLALLALAGALAIHRGARTWDKEAIGSATVQILPSAKAEETNQRMEASMQLLLGQAGVLRIQPLPPEAGANLIAPWLGALESAADLPIPRLIALSIDPAIVSQAAIREALKAVPGVRYQDHLTWLEPIRRTAILARWLAAAILGIIGGAAALTVVFATRTALAVQQDVIEVLHLIGARDSYIAAGLARQTMGRALLGALSGGFLAVALLRILSFFAADAPALLHGIHLATLDWIWIALLPLSVSALAAIVAYLAALQGLARLP